jgi:hypothetical protein
VRCKFDLSASANFIAPSLPTKLSVLRKIQCIDQIE